MPLRPPDDARRRASGRRLTVLRRLRLWVGLLVLGLVGTGLPVLALIATAGGSSATGVDVGPVAPLQGGLNGLTALPSVPPAPGFEAGGGGLAGTTWGLFGNPNDNSIMRASGVQVDLSAPGWGPGPTTYAVLDAGSTTQVWPAIGVSSSPIVPAGVLRNGGAYEVVIATGAQSIRRAFTVESTRAASVAGAVQTTVASPKIAVNTGQKLSLGLAYSSADVGVTATSGALGRLSAGLPAGWSWSGVAADTWRVEVADGSASLPGVTRVLKVFSGNVLLLGCRASAASAYICDTADGQLVGEGPRAVINADGSVVLTEQTSGQTLTFDPQGRVVRIVQPGTPPLAVAYTAAGGLASLTWEVGAAPLVWSVFYAGDARCVDTALPAGFSPTPAGLVCGWSMPSGQITRLLYTAPAGGQPRLSRAAQLPACSASMADCDPNQTAVNDFGWDAQNRLASTRDSLTVRATVAGLIDPTDQSHWGQMVYDGLGRVATTLAPSPVVDDRGRLEAAATVITARSTYGPAAAAFAPATQQATLSSTAAGSTLTTTTAVDDGGRAIAAQNASGGVATQVWAPYDDLLLAAIDPNGQAKTTEYDQWFRRTATFAGPLSVFGPDCAPAAAGRGTTDTTTGDYTACAPVDATTTHATAQVIGYDDPASVGHGLTATAFAAAPTLPSPFSGNPTGHVAADQAAEPSPGVPIAAVAPNAAAGSGVRLDGGIVVPVDEGTTPNSWGLQITAPPDLVTSGVVLANGQFCAALVTGSGAGSCTLTPDSQSRAQHLTIDIQLARTPTAADAIVIELDDPLGENPLDDNSFLVRRWSADTTLTSTDPLPAGTIATWSPQSVITHAYGCGEPGSAAAAQIACIGSAATETHDATGLKLAYGYTYESDGFGGVRLASSTQPDGQGTTTYSYWGVDDTPAGLPHAAQLGDLVTVAQRNLPKTMTLPGGRATTTVYDAFGAPVCQQIGSGNWTCTTLDATRRPVSHVVRADEAGVPTITITTDYAPGGNPLVNRTTRAQSGQATTTDQTVLDPSGRVLAYTDTIGTATTYGYDALGRLGRTVITPPTSVGRKDRPRAAGTTAGPSFTYASQFDATTGLQTGITYQGQPLVTIAHGDSARPWLPTGYTYHLPGGTVTNAVDYDSDLDPYGHTWVLADGSTLADCATAATAPAACTAALGDSQPGTTAGGRLLARSVDGQSIAYTYDTARRLQSATIGATKYVYTWDEDNNLRAKAITTPTGTEDLTYGYDGGGALTATDDPLAAIPATGAFDADGNHTQVGPETYTYDALGQLAAMATAASGSTPASTTTYTRDAQGRITGHTVAPGGTYHLGYSLPDDHAPTVAIDAQGTAQPIVALPGGLLFRGNVGAPVLMDAQGNSLLTLTVDGRRPAAPSGGPQPVALYEPFGQPTPTNPPPASAAAAAGPDFGWQAGQSDGAVVDLGARSLNTRLNSFLQPDPRPQGSKAGPYSYTSADPVNQSDPTGLCVGWGCVKEANDYLGPIFDALSLISCVLGFAVACVATSLARLAVSVLNIVADVELHQDFTADAVSAAMALFNVVAALPLAYEAGQISKVAEQFGIDRSAVDNATGLGTSERGAAAFRSAEVPPPDGVWNWVRDSPIREARYLQIDPAFDDLAVYTQRALALTRAANVGTLIGSYAARITSGSLYGCCWKVW